MAISSVDELPGGSAGEDEKGGSTYERRFQVITSSVLVGGDEVRLATGIPRRGDSYVSAAGGIDDTALAKDIKAQQDDDSPRRWEVTVSYGTPSTDGQGQQVDQNPLLRPASISYGFVKSSRVVWKDVDGQGILNSAGEYFDPPPEMDDSRPTMTVTRNLISYNPALAVQYQDAVNSDQWLGQPPGVVKVAGIAATSQFEGNVFYWQVTAEFEFRREGWQLSILDQGRNYKNPTDGNVLPIGQLVKNADGSTRVTDIPVGDPVPLNGSGLAIRNPTPETVVYRNFTTYKSLPFAALGMI